MPLLIAIMLPCMPLAAAQPATGFAAMNDSQIDAYLRRLSGKAGLTQRIEDVSREFLGVPFVFSPLGEGPGNPPDSDPLISFKAADCTTFVEETLALALSVNLKRAEELLKKLRYNAGRVDYLQRKHFMMAQWIPLNQQAGYIKDVTRQVGGSLVRVVAKRLGPQVWSKRRPEKNWPLLDPDQVPRGVSRLPIIPIESVQHVAERIQPGTILFVVREDFGNMPVRISHMGLVVEMHGKRFLRHASRVFGRVADERLDAFFARNRAYKRWPVEGINLQQVLDKCVQK